MSSLTWICFAGVSPNCPSTLLTTTIERPMSAPVVGAAGWAGGASSAHADTVRHDATIAKNQRRRLMRAKQRAESAAVDQRLDGVDRPEDAGRRAVQRHAEGRVDVIGGQVDRHMVAEMRQYSGHVEAGDPFPRVLLLGRAGPADDAASQIGYTRRPDHDHTPATASIAS